VITGFSYFLWNSLITYHKTSDIHSLTMMNAIL
jgi:hypothetical protein